MNVKLLQQNFLISILPAYHSLQEHVNVCSFVEKDTYQIKIAEPPYFKVARLSAKTRCFPSLSSGRFGFVLFKTLFFHKLYVKKDTSVNGTAWYRLQINQKETIGNLNRIAQSTG